jgi:hypothetical protein
MSRLVLAAALLALLPAVSTADAKKDVDAKKSGVIPAGLIGEAKPVACATCPNATGANANVPVNPFEPGSFAGRVFSQTWWDRHNCAPDGCPTPLGCSNHFTEKKFLFGSCRQFFGSTEGTVGTRYNTVVPENR